MGYRFFIWSVALNIAFIFLGQLFLMPKTVEAMQKVGAVTHRGKVTQSAWKGWISPAGAVSTQSRNTPGLPAVRGAVSHNESKGSHLLRSASGRAKKPRKGTSSSLSLEADSVASDLSNSSLMSPSPPRAQSRRLSNTSLLSFSLPRLRSRRSSDSSLMSSSSPKVQNRRASAPSLGSKLEPIRVDGDDGPAFLFADHVVTDIPLGVDSNIFGRAMLLEQVDDMAARAGAASKVSADDRVRSQIDRNMRQYGGPKGAYGAAPTSRHGDVVYGGNNPHRDKLERHHYDPSRTIYDTGGGASSGGVLWMKPNVPWMRN